MNDDLHREDRRTRREPSGYLSASSASSGWIVVVLSIVFLVLHLPYLPASLEDLDSINFALGVRRFDVAQHQPHPPGYPVFIAAAKIVRVVAGSELTALALLSIAAGALGVLAIAAVFRRLDRGEATWMPALLVAITSPLYWFTAARPLSDMTGLAAAIGVQALTLGAATTAQLTVAAFAAGVATGIRSQLAWLTVPLLILVGARGSGVADAGGSGLAGARGSGLADAGGAGLAEGRQAPGAKTLAAIVVSFAAGALVWFIPLVILTGGPAAYWRALSNQGAEDLGNISMLWTTHDARAAAEALYFAFVAPWATWTMAAIVLAFTASGIAWLWRHQRSALVVLAAAFGPYLIFDLLFQETFTGRYALPLVVPIAYLAAAGTRFVPARAGLVACAAIAMFDAHVGGTSIAAYSRQKAPAFRLLDDMAARARAGGVPPVLAMDRRNSFDFRRPIAWQDGAMPPIARTLPAPPQHEWLEAVRYWTSGGRAPVWFVVDPKRTAIDLVQHGPPARYRWPLAYPSLVSGARPDEMDWYRVDRPEWYVGEGWSLTPEAAGVAAADTRGLEFGPIHAGISRQAISGAALLIGGRHFQPAAPAHVAVSLAGRPILDIDATGDSFLRVAYLPTAQIDGPPDDYDALTVTSTAHARVAVEQFDISAERTLRGFGAGWHEAEFNPATGKQWRWLSERGELKLAGRPWMPFPADAVRAPRTVTLHIEGESPRRYFSRGSRLVVRSGDRVAFDRVLDDDFSIDVPIADAADTIVLETNQVYVPAERSRRSQDRRHLGLRIFTCEVR